MEPDMVLQNLRHKAVDAATDSSQQHQHIGTLIARGQRALHGGELSADALDAKQQLLLFAGNLRYLVLHFFSCPYERFTCRYPKGVCYKRSGEKSRWFRQD